MKRTQQSAIELRARIHCFQLNFIFCEPYMQRFPFRVTINMSNYNEIN